MKHLSGDLAREETIRVKAYEIWLSRGCPHGTEEQDWIEAERNFESLALEPSASKDDHPSLMEPEKPAPEPAVPLVQIKASGAAKRSAGKRSSRSASSGVGGRSPAGCVDLVESRRGQRQAASRSGARRPPPRT